MFHYHRECSNKHSCSDVFGHMYASVGYIIIGEMSESRIYLFKILIDIANILPLKKDYQFPLSSGV